MKTPTHSVSPATIRFDPIPRRIRRRTPRNRHALAPRHELLEARLLLTAPVVSAFTSDPVSPVTLGTLVSLQATASDADLGDSVASLNFYEDSNSNGLAEESEFLGSGTGSGSDWSYDWSTSSRTAGTVNFLAVAVDTTKVASTPRPLSISLVNLTYDTAPVVDTFSYTPASPITAGTVLHLTATAHDNDAGDSVTAIRFYDDQNANGPEPSELIGQDENPAGGWTFDWDSGHHAAGSVTLLAVAEDTDHTTGAARSTGLTLVSPSTDRAPTNLRISDNVFQENLPAGTTVGSLSTTDPDTGDSFAYSLVAGSGSTDNALFTIVNSSGNWTLRTNAFFNFEIKPSCAVRVRTTDAGGLNFEKALTLYILNVNEAPTGLSLSPASVVELRSAGAEVGHLAATDPEPEEGLTYALVSGSGDTNNGLFTLAGDLLLTAAQLHRESSPLSIRVRVTDAGGLSFTQALTVTVTPDVIPPQVVSSVLDVTTGPHRVRVHFSEDVSASLQNGDLKLRNTTTNTLIAPAVTSMTYDSLNNTATWTFPGIAGGILPNGNYRVTLTAGDVLDAAGNMLDGNGDFIAGDDFVDNTPFVLGGDVNRDRAVSFPDLVTVAQHYGNAGSYAQGDLNGDGVVSFADLVLVAQNYGASLPIPASASVVSSPALASVVAKSANLPDPSISSRPKAVPRPRTPKSPATRSDLQAVVTPSIPSIQSPFGTTRIRRRIRDVF